MANDLSNIIINKSQELIKQLIPKIIDIAYKIGIEKIGQLEEKLPDQCLVQEELKKVLQLRNNLINKLNSTSQTIETLSKSIDPLTTLVNTTSNALKTTKTSRIAATAALNFIPSPPGTPGAVISTINNLKDLEEFLNPKIVLGKNKITSIKTALDFSNQNLVKTLNLLKSIDEYLINCGIDPNELTSINSYMSTINNLYLQQQNTFNSNIYQGFFLEIETIPYSPTVNRRRAVAKNKDGIVLLQTPLSFTTLDQVLIEELKLIIDTNNLKAN